PSRDRPAQGMHVVAEVAVTPQKKAVYQPREEISRHGLNLLKYLPEKSIRPAPVEYPFHLETRLFKKSQKSVVGIPKKVIRHLVTGPIHGSRKNDVSTRANHPEHLPNGFGGIGYVLQNFSADHRVE